jgi:hypothetical protein
MFNNKRSLKEYPINKLGKITIKLAAVIQILAITLLAACTTSPLTVCHASGDAANPYEEITVTSAEMTDHRGHPNDINPAPLNGCPTSPVEIINGEITICHATNSESNPYNEITVSVNGLNGHGGHEGDIIPMPDGGCPANPAATNTDMITICHATSSEKNPYNEITVSVNGLNGHDKHEGDIIPAPAGGCPTMK